MSIGDYSIGEAAIGEELSGTDDHTLLINDATHTHAADNTRFYHLVEDVASTLNITGEADQAKSWYYYQESGFLFTTAHDLSQGYVSADGITLTEAVTHGVTGTTLVNEIMTLEAQGVVLFDALTAETVDFENAMAYELAVRVVDALLLTGAEESRLSAISSVAEAIALSDVGGVVDVANVAEAVQLAETIMANIIAYENHADIVTVTEAPTWLISIYIDTADEIQFTNATELAQQLTLLIEEGVEFSVGLRLGTDVYAAWLVNTATTGSSRYENFPFNSFAEGPAGYYGAADDGIYLMQGDTDDGVAIDASIKSGLYDFGERKSKRIHDVFLGVLTSGDLVLKVTADEQGTRTEAWYEVVHHGDADNHRAKVGKGLRGVYWGWELVNVDGADLDLNNVQMYPLTLSRRV